MCREQNIAEYTHRIARPGPILRRQISTLEALSISSTPGSGVPNGCPTLMTLTLSTNPQFFASAIADLGLELLLPARLEGLELLLPLLLPLLFVCFRRCGRLSLEERVGRGILANRECGTCSVLQCQCCQGDLEGQAQSRACKRMEAALIFHSTTAS